MNFEFMIKMNDKMSTLKSRHWELVGKSMNLLT